MRKEAELQNEFLDEKDQKVLRLLKENSKLTTNQISKKTNLPITTVHNRIKKLEKDGIIKKYSVVLDKEKTGKNISAYILVSVVYSHDKKFSQEETAKRIRSFEEVEEVNIVTGETDIVVKVTTENITTLNDFLLKKLRNIDGIDKTRTLVILKEF